MVTVSRGSVIMAVLGTVAAFVTFVGACYFAALLLTGVSKAGAFWELPGVFYAVVLLVLTLAFLLGPKNAGSVVWFVTRVCVLPALAGLSETLFILGNDWVGFVALAVGAFTAVILMLYAVVGICFGIAVRLLAQNLNRRGWFYGVTKFVWKQMDKFFLSEVTSWRDAQDTVQLVQHSHPVIVVEALMYRFLPNMVAGIVATYGSTIVVLGITLVVQVFVPLVTRRDTQFSWELPVTLLVVAQLLITLGIMSNFLWAYWVQEYARLHSGLIVSINTLTVVLFTFPSGTTKGAGPINAFRMIKRGSPGEGVGKESPSFWAQAWDNFLKSRSRWSLGENVAKLYFPVVAQQGSESIDFLANADWITATIARIAELSAQIEAMNPRSKIATLLMDPTSQLPAVLGRTGAGTLAQIPQLRTLFLQRAAELTGVSLSQLESDAAVSGGGLVDNMQELLEGDPGIWCIPAAMKYVELTEITSLTREEVLRAESEDSLRRPENRDVLVSLLASRGYRVYNSPRVQL